MACRPASIDATGANQLAFMQPMSDNPPNAEQPASSGPGPGYGLPNQAVPLPRQWQWQWQLPPPQPTTALRSQSSMHFYPGPAVAGSWQQTGASRRMERAILFGLWLLVMLAAIAIGLRLLDLSALGGTVADPSAQPFASADSANAMRSAALAVAISTDVDPFDEPAPAFLPEPPPAAPVPTEASARPAARLISAATLADERPVAPSAVALARPAGSGPVCADALWAMQLCPDMR